MREIFERIYRENLWLSDESVSGTGSTMEATEVVRWVLPELVDEYEILTILDIPCGDWNWFSQLWESKLNARIDKYIGADIVPDLIKANREKYWGMLGVEFKVMDLTNDLLPRVDLILARDILGHFSNYDVQKALRNIKRSRAKYLLSTTFPGEPTEGDIETGQWRPINLERMWGLPPALRLFAEADVEFEDGHISKKCLGLWRLDGK